MSIYCCIMYIYSEIQDARARAGPKSNINPASISKLLVNLSCLRLVLEMVSNIYWPICLSLACWFSFLAAQEISVSAVQYHVGTSHLGAEDVGSIKFYETLISLAQVLTRVMNDSE